MSEREKPREIKNVRALSGDKVNIFHPDGIITVSVGEKLGNFEVRITPFTHKAARIRTERAMITAVLKVAEQFKTEVASLATDPEISFNASVSKFLEEGLLERVFLSAIRMGIDPAEIKELVKSNIILAGGFPEKHMGILHESAGVLIEELQRKVDFVYENRNELEAEYAKKGRQKKP